MSRSFAARLVRFVRQVLVVTIALIVTFGLIGFGTSTLLSRGWIKAPTSAEEQRRQEETLIDWAVPAIVVVAGLGAWLGRRRKS